MEKTEETEVKKSVGRPRIEFDEKDWKLLDSCIIWGTKVFCADKLNVNIDTLNERIQERYGCNFSTYKDKKREDVRNNLRLKQYEIAMKGNVTMLIFLGKNELGQSDKVENTNVNLDLNEAKKEINQIFGFVDIP